MSRARVMFDEHGELAEYALGSPASGRRRPLSPDDDLELAALVGLGWERRGEPDFREHIEAIEDWWGRRSIRAFERRQRSLAAVLQVLRETAPRPKGGCRDAA
jgi:hypothetical protein